jgi:O-antigen ligase
MTRTASRRPINTLVGPASTAWPWVTTVALVLVLGVTVARLMTVDVLRDVGSPVPGGDATNHGPGPGTALVFDLVAALPALLVLARRVLDRDYRLAGRKSHLLLLGLTLWMSASVFWSADRFAAVVSTAHFAGAACLLWAASQVVRSWDRLRVVAAVALGLLLALVIHTGIYRFVDVANTRAYWVTHKAEFLREHNWAPGSFPAVQFEHKLITGEQSAYFNSANTLASVGVLLLFAAAGLGVQRSLDDRDPRWLALTGVAVAAGGWILLVARSKTSIVTPVVGVSVLVAWWWFGDHVRRRATVAYWSTLAALGSIGVAVIGHGLYHHGLFPGHFSNSLDFRWKYWTASAGVYREHPLVGVGWANFGGSYLAHRVPEAAEEIKDPHNFLVRFATELGVVGLLLAVGWLLRLAWEVTRPAGDAAPASADPPARVGIVGWVACLGIGMSVLAAVDFTNPLDALVLLMQPVLMLLAIVLGGIVGSMRSPDDRAADDRPGPWVFATIAVGLGMFLLHNLIDFAWFEPGAMFAFMTLAGAVQGVAPIHADQRQVHRGWAVGGLAAGAVVWVAVALGIALPVGLASQAVQAGDDGIRAADPNQPAAVAAAYRAAVDRYADAAAAVPYDAEVPAQAGNWARAFGDTARARRLVDDAIRSNPRLIEAWLRNAELCAAAGDVAGARAAYGTAVRLNPNDVSIRLQYAEALDKLHDRADAAAQYAAALAADAALPAEEPKRLPPERVAELRKLAG